MADTRSESFTQVSVPDGYAEYLLSQLFEPWAAVLTARARIRPGQRVLDVASGLGPVARLAAEAAGPGGRVTASDISGAMLAAAAARPAPSGWAPVEYLECPAAAIAADDDSFDVVLCQHGLQFFPDRPAAAAEMRRVARPGGTVALSTWAAERPLGLFGAMNETLLEFGVAEPFPSAFNSGSYRVGLAELRDLMLTAGFHEVSAETVELDATWQTGEAATAALLGTPFGPLVSALPAGTQQQIRARLASKLGASPDGACIRTVSNIVQGTKQGATRA
jgi:ubiquinone/menaquinone biosynthesis C-methylase UbiE